MSRRTLRDLAPTDATEPVRPAGALWAQIYEATRRRILSCDLVPGAPLSELGLAREYDTSPTPVRDALGRLRQEGLVTFGPGRAYRVAPLMLADIRELAELRFVLESGIVRLATQRALPEGVARLRDLARISGDDALTAGGLIACNRSFHLALADLARNAALSAALARVLDDSERLFHLGIRALPAPEMEQTHLALVDALERGNVDGALAICEREAFGTSERVLQQLLREPPAGERQVLTVMTAKGGA